MSFYTKNGKTIFYSHIPKTGGSSVDLFLSNGVNYVRTFWGGYNGKNVSYHHRHATDAELIKEKSKYNIIYQFTVIRDPVERFLSEFFMRQHPHKGKTEKDFQKFVINNIETYKNNNNVNDNHIRPQYEFIHENMEIFKFGEWDKIIKKLNIIDNVFPEKIKNINYSTDLKNSTKFASEILGWGPTKETIEMIKDFYKKDYELFDL